MAFSELDDSSGSFSYITPSSDQDMDDATLGKLLTEAHRGQADHCEQKACQSVSRRCLLCSIEQGNLREKEMSINQLVLVSRETRAVLTASFLKTPKLRKWSIDQGNLMSDNSSNAQIRTLLEEQRQMIIAEYCLKIGHHEIQAAHAEEERRILREELWRQQMDFREVHQQSLSEMEELRKFQSSTFDTLARQKFIEDQKTTMELSGRLQELQNEENCMIDSWDFRDAGRFVVEIPTLPVDQCLSHHTQYQKDC